LKEESKEPISPQEEKKAPEPEEKPKESTGKPRVLILKNKLYKIY